jgi:hypothetical protein
MALPEFVKCAITAPVPPPGSLYHKRPGRSYQSQRHVKSDKNPRATPSRQRPLTSPSQIGQGAACSPRTVIFGMPGDR